MADKQEKKRNKKRNKTQPREENDKENSGAPRKVPNEVKRLMADSVKRLPAEPVKVVRKLRDVLYVIENGEQVAYRRETPIKKTQPETPQKQDKAGAKKKTKPLEPTVVLENLTQERIDAIKNEVKASSSAPSNVEHTVPMTPEMQATVHSAVTKYLDQIFADLKPNNAFKNFREIDEISSDEELQKALELSMLYQNDEFGEYSNAASLSIDDIIGDLLNLNVGTTANVSGQVEAHISEQQMLPAKAPIASMGTSSASDWHCSTDLPLDESSLGITKVTSVEPVAEQSPIMKPDTSKVLTQGEGLVSPITFSAVAPTALMDTSSVSADLPLEESSLGITEAAATAEQSSHANTPAISDVNVADGHFLTRRDNVKKRLFDRE